MKWNRDKNKNRRAWHELMNKLVINKIGIHYQTMYKNKDFDAECSFNRIQYRVDSVSKNTISK